MIRLIYISTLLIMFSTTIHSQHNTSEEDVIALVELVEAKHTGKRHNSIFFTFKIKEILEGELNDSIIKFPEIFQGFGGGNILSKLYPGRKINMKGEKAEHIVIKFSKEKNPEEKSMPYAFIWVAEENRITSFKNLERLLIKRGLKRVVFEYPLMLWEHNGLLFFTDNDLVRKAALEYRPGDWIFAILEKQEY